MNIIQSQILSLTISSPSDEKHKRKKLCDSKRSRPHLLTVSAELKIRQLPGRGNNSDQEYLYYRTLLEKHLFVFAELQMLF